MSHPSSMPTTFAAGLLLAIGALTTVAAADGASSGMAKPQWATDIGSDGAGTWATLTVDNQVQKFRLIPAGRFVMGTDGSGGEPDEHPVRQVELSRPYWLADSEVTQGLWQAVMLRNPSHFPTQDDLPVESVSWPDCQEFLTTLNSKIPDLKATLPTEAQWEFACRAGSTGDFADNAEAMAWTKQNSDEHSHPVKGRQANAWGLYDMYGNVCEWCSDWYAFGAYATEAVRDPTGAESGTHRVVRGGGWLFNLTRSADRHAMPPETRDAQIGLRLVIPATP